MEEEPNAPVAATVISTPMGSPRRKGNGKSPRKSSNGKKSPSSPKTESSHSTTSTLGCLIVAVLSFAAGVFGPPALSYRNALHTQRRLNKALEETRPFEEGDRCSTEVLSQFLHDEPVRGLHLACVSDNNDVTLYRNAVASSSFQVPLASDWKEFKTTLKNHLGLLPLPNKQSWAVFSSRGVKLATGDDTEANMDKMHGLLVIMRGGQWLWPGVRIGFRRTVDLSYVPGLPAGGADSRNATVETLSLRPLVVSVEGFLSDEECNHIQELATPHLRYSGVTLKDVDQGRPSSDFRTSQSTFLQPDDDTLKTIDYRTASLVRMPRSHQEYVQVLRYGFNEHYAAHHDYFDPKHYEKDPHTLRLIQHGRRNRLATVFWYLSDVAEGGETAFPRFNGAPTPKDFTDCSKGLLVKPQRGKVIIFYSLTADGTPDPLSLHGACRVKEGIKWAANKWVWNEPMEYISNA